MVRCVYVDHTGDPFGIFNIGRGVRGWTNCPGMVRCVYLDHTGDRFFDIGLGVRGCGRNIGRFFDRVKNKNVKNTKMRKQLIFDLDFQNVKKK